MLMFMALLFLLARCDAYKLAGEFQMDRRCIVYKNEAFSGIRIHRSWNWTPQLDSDQWRQWHDNGTVIISRCEMGHVKAVVHAESNEKLFNRTFCDFDARAMAGPHGGELYCFRFTRAKRYHSGAPSPRLALSLVGAAFEAKLNSTATPAPRGSPPGSLDYDSALWKPLSPLLSDRWQEWFVQPGFGQLDVLIPRYRTAHISEPLYPRSDDWTVLVSPFEPV